MQHYQQRKTPRDRNTDSEFVEYPGRNVCLLELVAPQLLSSIISYYVKWRSG
jgi:hypothetical protein